MASKSLGGIDGLDGWAKTKDFIDQTGKRTIELKGSVDNLKEALKKVREDYDGSSELNIDTDEQTATATISIVTSEIEGGSIGTDADNDESKSPTWSLQGTMLSPQLHQSPYFQKGNNKLSTEAVVAVDYCIKNYGQVTRGDLFSQDSIAHLYASWRMYGIDTYLAPSYNFTVTHYLKAGRFDKVKNYVKKAGMVFKFDSIINNIPARLQPKDIDVKAWLAQAPTINMQGEEITVSQSFIGADAFPTFYEAEDQSLLYDAPQIPDGYWRNSKYIKLTSGKTDETN